MAEHPLLALGTSCQAQAQPWQAREAFAAYVKACPDDALGWRKLAEACRALQLSFHEALCLERALALNPADPELHELLYYCWVYLGQREGVQAYFERMLQTSAAGTEWFAAQPARLREIVRANRLTIQYQALIAAFGDPALSDAEIFAYAAGLPQPQPLSAPAEGPPGRAEGPPGRPLRLGYLSCELGFFSSARHLWLLLKHHSPAVELYAYDDTPPPKRNAAFREAFAHWREVHGLDNRTLAARIRADGIDVLLDMGGLTNAGRNGVYAYKPAPVQIGGLGFGFSACHRAIEYHFGDASRCPPEVSALYPETVIRLASSYHWEPPGPLELSEPPSRRKGFITFGSANTLNKLNPRVLALWTRILHEVPSSQLYLKTPVLGDDYARAYWYALFAAYGIGRERLRFAGHRDRLHMADFYPEVDIALDPFPYQGGVTSCEALWMGVPVVALLLPQWRARSISPTILGAMGLQAWICHSEAEYLQRALAWAADADFLTRQRGELRERLRGSRICDGPAAVHEIETACLALWQSKRKSRT